MLSLHNCFIFLCLVSVLRVSCEDLTPSKQEESSPEGSSVTLFYRYSKTIAASDYFYWYRQYPGKPPEFLILHWGTKPASNSRLSVKSDEDKTQIYLSISSAAVTDSAVYYCAVRPTVTGNTNTLYTNLWSKDNTILINIHQREPLSVRLQGNNTTNVQTTQPPAERPPFFDASTPRYFNLSLTFILMMFNESIPPGARLLMDLHQHFLFFIFIPTGPEIYSHQTTLKDKPRRFTDEHL
nr:uncharacterized protein LOC117444396 [Pseudochaenichthys georgianus]